MKREDIRKEINSNRLTEYIPLERSRKAGKGKYICPICGSGTGKHSTGALHIYEDNRVICFAGDCFTSKGEDTLGALRTIWQCDEGEVFRRLGYALDYEHEGHGHEKSATPAKAPEKEKDYSSFFRRCHEDLKNTPEALTYLHDRGISDNSIDRFKLGYCANWKHSTNSSRALGTKRIIIPRTKRSFLARLITEPRNEYEATRKKQVEGAQKDLFNLGALKMAETPFICEGELDAISLYQAGANDVIGIGATGNAGDFAEIAKKRPDAVYILALDNDESGRKAQESLAEKLKESGLAVLEKDPAELYGLAKDANEAFIKDRERLENKVNALQMEALDIKQRLDEEREAELKKRTGEGMLDNFLLKVTDKENRYYEPLQTGINDIDRALEGGFIRGTLVMLGAPPAMGKTALAQWIFESNY